MMTMFIFEWANSLLYHVLFLQMSCYFQKQLFMNLDGTANMICIELPSLYHRFVEFFFMLSPSLFLSPVSFIHYQLIWQHLSEKWHASNQTSFPMTSSSHLEGFMDAGLCQCSGCEWSGSNCSEVYPQCHGQSCQHKWPWLITPQLWRKRQHLQCSPTLAWVISLCLDISQQKV